MTAHRCLVGDIGGTNARFALADPNGGYVCEHTLGCADFASAQMAIQHYLDTVGAPAPEIICLAAAGPIVEQRVRFTNNHWLIDSAELGAAFATGRVRLINDFEALAWSIPALGEHDGVGIGSSPPPALPLKGGDYTVAITGPGTGLGAAGLMARGGTVLPIPGEASHGGFAPETHVQIEILQALRERFERVSCERVVSGPGIENLYWALCTVHGEPHRPLAASAVFAAAESGRDPCAAEAVQVFFEILGQFAGDLALSLNARDGVFIAGGIAGRYPGLLASGRFRSGFENKGRQRSLMRRIPTPLITHPQPGLLGAACCALAELS